MLGFVTSTLVVGRIMSVATWKFFSNYSYINIFLMVILYQIFLYFFSLL